MKRFIFQIIVSLLLLLEQLHGELKCGQNWDVTPHVLQQMQNSNHKRSTRDVAERQTSSNGFNINVIFNGNVPADFMTQFQVAVDIWEELLADTVLTEDINIDFSVAALGAGILGSTASVPLVADYATYQDAIESHTGMNFPTEAFLRANVNLPNGVTLQTNMLVQANKPALKALGFEGLDESFGASDGDITFSSNFNFDTDPSDGINQNEFDFTAVAVHEIGHLLGFTSIVDNIDLGQNVVPIGALDLFRFFSQETFGTFTDSTRHMTPDGINFHILRDFDGTVIGNLSQGQNAFAGGPESNQASHWRDNANAGQATLGIMDPTLGNGEILGTSPNDDLAMFFLGYSPSPAVQPTIVGVFPEVDGTSLIATGFNFRDTVCDVVAEVTFTDLPATIADGFGAIQIIYPQPITQTPTLTCRNLFVEDGNNASVLSFTFSLVSVLVFFLLF